MLVDDRGDIWVIDFERSGPGPILQDFVELEADLLNRLVASEGRDFAKTFALGVWSAFPTTLDQLPLLPDVASPQMNKAMQVIVSLRRLAHQCTGESDARPYLWGLMLNALFRATLLPGDEAHQREQLRALMLASILCHRLEHWGQPWPPKHWPNIYDDRR
jgi:Ser/Thr protein kinase RdoA (MazF antagonist)